MSDDYRYHRPQVGLTEALVGLGEALAAYFAVRPPCPDDVQTALLLTPAALCGGEREEAFNQLHRLTLLAYQHNVSPGQEERLASCLQEARRTLAMGDVFIAGVDYRQDLVEPTGGGMC
jgi:hypothetical protein